MRDNRLTAMKVAALIRAAKPGYYADGGSLYLQISRWGTASWTFRYRVGDKLRTAGLGSTSTISLAEAREESVSFRKKLKAYRDGKTEFDPIDERKAAVLARRLEASKTMSFRDCAKAYITAHAATWKNATHAKQWPSTLEMYAYPVFGDLSVAAIDVGLVMKAIEPIWNTKPETANRVRGRVESILDWARVRGYRAGENPARWKGHLDSLLPRPSKAKEAARRAKGRDGHHAALAYAEIADLVRELRAIDGIAARALEFTVLTAARTGEVIGTRWDEIDDMANPTLWTIAADRMKVGKEHRVPLSADAAAIIKQMAAIRQGDFVFPGQQTGRPLSNMALLMTLRRMKRTDLTVHGFRSTFSDWAAERTAFPAEVREMALAHSVGNKVEAAYRRGDLFQKRRQIMEAWAKYCAAPQAATGGKVVSLGQARA